MAVPVAAPNSAAIEEAHDDFSFGRPCVCHHLHQSCSPRTCREAAKRKAGRTRPQNIPIEGSSKLSDRPLFMGATLERLRQAAVRGCLVCGFLYAGLNAPLDAKMSWIADEKEEDIVVVIRRSTDFVQVYSRATAGRGGKYAVFTFYASTDSTFLASCKAFLQSATVSYSTSSQESFDIATKWIQECVRSHRLCAIPDSPVLPTRVIDLGPYDDPDFQPYLLETRGYNASYVALSHCWGNMDILTTTKETLHSREKHIEMSSLSQMMREAILVTRRLRVRYLWIDSLCIIQDDEAEWQFESARMASIYEHAVFTISARRAIGGDGSLFSITPSFHGTNSWEITTEHNGSNCDAEEVILSHPVGQSIGSDEETCRPVNSNPSLNFRTGSGEGTDGGKDMNNDKDTGNGEYTESDGIIKHYHPSKSYIENISRDFLGDGTRGGYCVALFAPSSNGRAILHYVLGTYSKSTFPEDVLFSEQPSGIFVRKHVHLDHVQFSYDKHPHLPHNHLASRAWAFQERLLSTRILHYTQRELVWECKTVTKCQCNSITDTRTKQFVEGFGGMGIDGDGESARSLKVLFEQSISSARTPVHLMEAWMRVVFHYSALHLSHSSDRLPALSGLAKRFQRAGGLGAYVAGMWSSCLPRLLSWNIRKDVPLPRPTTFPAPSWSWASVIGGVYFPSRLALLFSSLKEHSQSEIVGQVLDVQCTPAGSDPTGAVSGGQLTVSGKVIQAKLRIRPKGATNSDDALDDMHQYQYHIVHKVSDIETEFVPDSLSHIDVLTQEYDVACLLWSIHDGPFQEKGGSKSWASHSLVLRPVTDNPNTFVRVGLLAIWEGEAKRHNKESTWQGWYQDAEERQLVII